MKNKVFTFYSELPPWAKGVIIIAGGAILYFTAKNLIDRIKKDATIKNAKATVTNTKKDLQSLLNKGNRLSYPISKYNALTSVLASAFNGYGTAEDQIYGVFNQIKNTVDMLQLIVTYDVRTIKGGWLAEDWQDDLPGSIASELLPVEIAKINTILKNNKVDYQFGGGY